MEEDCVYCGLPIVWLEPRGIWRTANPKATPAPYVCQANPTGDHKSKEIVLWHADEPEWDDEEIGKQVYGA